jgi:hypothetical protein
MLRLITLSPYLHLLQCVKKNMIVNIVPVVIHLKAVLQEKNSRLVPHLMLYVRDMMKEYKNEVGSAFSLILGVARQIVASPRC